MEDVLLASLDAKEAKEETQTSTQEQDEVCSTEVVDPMASWRRMIFSDYFTIHMAMHYLHKRCAQDLQELICERMKQYAFHQVEFYLPQIICMCLMDPVQYQSLRHFLLDASTRDMHFALLATWLLQAELENSSQLERKLTIEVLLHEINISPCLGFQHEPSSSLGEDLESSFDGQRQHTLADAMRLERTFVHKLLSVGERLRKLQSRDARRTQLFGELSRVNLELPSRTYLPLSIGGFNGLGTATGDDAADEASDLRQKNWRSHHVVRIPPEEAVVLNSKDRAPYMLQVEVVDCDDFYTSALPAKQRFKRRPGHLRSQSDGASFVKSLDELVRTRSATDLDMQDEELHSDRDSGVMVRHGEIDVTAEIQAHMQNVLAREDGSSRPTDECSSCPSMQASSPASQILAVHEHMEGHVMHPDSDDHHEDEDHDHDHDEQQVAGDEQDNQDDMQFPRPKLYPCMSMSTPATSAVTPSGHSPEPERSESAVPVKAMNIRLRLHEAASTPDSQFQRGHKDPSAIKAKEKWSDKVRRIRRLSPYGHDRSWRLIPVIIKSGDDLRQELLATQLLALFQEVWAREQIPLWIRPIRILVTSANGGMIEVVGSAVSLHQTKKQAGDTLLDYFHQQFGGPSSEAFLTAQQNFAQSLAAYSLFTYFAQVKDRHNGNIMIDSEGHILHIDFGFFLSNSPGRNMGFETAPFKLLRGFVEVLGGLESDMFRYFKSLLFKGFVAARKHKNDFVTALAIMEQGPPLPCFTKPTAVKDFEARFCEGFTDDELDRHVNKLIEKSLHSLRTRLYDNYQYLTNGIL
eukprot:m.15600 g.15600  ORF g.15600 m.15600 type:complete len:805 (+) comp7883_c0_seq1:73-2487(+)